MDSKRTLEAGGSDGWSAKFRHQQLTTPATRHRRVDYCKRKNLFRMFVPVQITSTFDVITFYSLCILASGILSLEAATGGSPQSPGAGMMPLLNLQQPAASQQAPSAPNMAPISTAATFIIPRQQPTSSPTSPASGSGHDQPNHQQPTTKRPNLMTFPSANQPNPALTAFTAQPSSVNSLTISKPTSTTPSNIDDLSNNNQAQGRSQTQSQAEPATPIPDFMTSNSSSTTTTTTTTPAPGSFDDSGFSTYSTDGTTAKPSGRNFDEPIFGVMDVSPTMHGPGLQPPSTAMSPSSSSPSFPPQPSSSSSSSSDRSSSSDDHDSLMESSLEHRLPTPQDPVAQPKLTELAPNSQFENVSMIVPSSVSPATSEQVQNGLSLMPSNSTRDADAPAPVSNQAVPPIATPEGPATNSTTSRESNGGDMSANLQIEGRNMPDNRPQSQPTVRPSAGPNSPPLNTTANAPDGRRVQILKPKTKFKCTQPSDCQNGALCHNGMCFCLPGFTGDTCDVNIDECRQHGGQPCFNGGVCIDMINEFKCECAPGFRGDQCQDLADMCNDSPCFNNATCTNHRTNYTCTCEPGWEGRHCELNIDDCAKNPCQNGATCQDLVNGYKCECPQGFMGTNCEINIDDCASNACQNNATCRDLINDYECECPPGFVGKNCEENLDECASSPCSPHGECQDLINGYKCECHDGWTGKQCENDINECESSRPVCLNGAACVNLDGSYQCNCRDGYTGK